MRLPSLIWSAALVATLGVAGAAQDTAALPRGQVVERIVTLTDPAHSYALYLPSQYNAQRPWPLIFVFDPAARGAVAVKVFQVAAERYGYIVVGSNNVRNGPIGPSIEAFSAVLADAQKRFSIDRSRLYAAGFSGGARVAGLIGFSCGHCIRAIIACGAGLPDGLSEERRAQLPTYFFSVGKYDFNYFEVADAAHSLPRVPRLAIFDGGHQWLPPDVAEQAIAWLEAGMPATALNLRITGEEEKQRQRQAELTQDLQRLMEAIQQGQGDREHNVADARAAMSSLRRKRNRATDDLEVTVLRRSLGGAFAAAYETGERLLHGNDPLLAASFFEIATEAVPSNPAIPYQAASAYAAAGDRAKAFAALRRAITAGFQDSARLQSDPSFARWSNSADFRGLVRSAGGR